MGTGVAGSDALITACGSRGNAAAMRNGGLMASSLVGTFDGLGPRTTLLARRGRISNVRSMSRIPSVVKRILSIAKCSVNKSKSGRKIALMTGHFLGAKGILGLYTPFAVFGGRGRSCVGTFRLRRRVRSYRFRIGRCLFGGG